MSTGKFEPRESGCTSNKSLPMQRDRNTAIDPMSTGKFEPREPGCTFNNSLPMKRDRSFAIDDDYDTAILVCREWSKQKRRLQTQSLKKSNFHSGSSRLEDSYDQSLRQTKSAEDGALHYFLEPTGPTQYLRADDQSLRQVNSVDDGVLPYYGVLPYFLDSTGPTGFSRAESENTRITSNTQKDQTPRKSKEDFIWYTATSTKAAKLYLEETLAKLLSIELKL